MGEFLVTALVPSQPA